MMQRAPIPGRSPRGPSRSIVLYGGALLVALALSSPAAATVKEVILVPSEPTNCDPVTIGASGDLSSPCYEIVGATITGPEPIPCLRLTPCPTLFRIEITVREPNPLLGAPCPLVIAPYARTFDVGRLWPGEYLVHAIERVMSFAPDSSGGVIESSFVARRFSVRADSTCQPNQGCYILDFVPDLPPPDSAIAWPLFCTATTAPGGTACLDLALLSSVPVAGLQTTVDVTSVLDSVPPDALIHATSVEPAGRASGFQVGWSAEGARTKIVLYSATGALIAPGQGPVVRICYAVAPETPPAIYHVVSHDEIVADSTGEAIVPCPTLVPIQPGRICIVAPGCDLNGDGVSDVLDVIRLVRCVLGAGGDSTACPDSVAARADCNGDGSLDVRDVICCVRKILRSWRGTEPLGGESPAGSPAAEIGFAGPVRWLNEVEGLAAVDLRPREDWGGAQFSLDPGGSPVRVRDVRLLESPASVQLEWAADETGVVHAILYSTATAPQAAGALCVQVALERIPGASGAGTLRLAGIRNGTLTGAPSPIAMVNAEVEIPEAVLGAPALLAARPNPFVGRTEVGFALPAETRVTFRLYDVAGRLVRTLVEGTLPAGVHRVAWDGRDSRGRTVPAGIYFVRLEAGRVHRSERLLLLR